MKDNKYLMAIVGILAGLMCGLFGVGILLAAYVSRVTDTTDEFKANMQLFSCWYYYLRITEDDSMSFPVHVSGFVLWNI